MSLRAVAILVVLLGTADASAQPLSLAVVGELQIGEDRELVLRGALTGDLTGTLKLTLRLDGDRVNAGDWSLFIVRDNGDGTTTDRGVLSGRVDKARVDTDGAGGLLGIHDIELVLTSGSGEYETRSQGRGTLDFRVGPVGEPVRASLQLTF